jgi:lipopolysaccharide/colanic/teichoic acid biosynthesis glycosyltransferase
MDVIYVESWSLMLDAKLLLRTPIALVRGSTARQSRPRASFE